jgi:hypothetical protein
MNEIINHKNNTQITESETLTIEQIEHRIRLVNSVFKAIMIEGEHYGIVAGCGNKPTLLKAGTEKLCTMFRLSPSFEVKCLMDNNTGHREYEVTTTLRHINTGAIWAQGLGCCSTKETKWMRRKDKEATVNPADYYNTVLKMAKKRSQADAVLTATGASDIFTQDLEDLAENEVIITNPKTNNLKRNINQQNNKICPKCGNQSAIIKGKEEYGGGWLCYKNKGGCGYKWHDEITPQIPQQKQDQFSSKHTELFTKAMQQIKESTNLIDATNICHKAKNEFIKSSSLSEKCIEETLISLEDALEEKKLELSQKYQNIKGD